LYPPLKNVIPTTRSASPPQIIFGTLSLKYDPSPMYVSSICCFTHVKDKEDSSYQLAVLKRFYKAYKASPIIFSHIYFQKWVTMKVV
jgi:hypothetical protein